MFYEEGKSSETASLILDGLPMGILFCDKNCIIRFVNKGYAALLSKQPNDLLGKHIMEVIPHSRAKEVMELGQSELGELCQLGPALPVIVNRLPVRNANGLVVGMISQAIFNDPEELQRLSTKIENLGRKLSQYKRRFRASNAAQYTFASILGDSEVINRLKRQGQSYARLDEPVLILGQTGTGKELFAHAVHSASSRSRGPLVCINCAAIPRDLFESELFGYVKGAFSGAAGGGKIGQIELAENGTLFLDEIGEMPPEIQAKLLRCLESRTIRRVGDVTDKAVDFRLIAATNRNISAMLKNGSFREDLYYRINTFVLEIPPLGERKEDILPIARYILQRMELDFVDFAPETVTAMNEFPWPGNVRQLHNAVVHAATMRKSDVLFSEDFPPETLPSMYSAKIVDKNSKQRYIKSEQTNLTNIRRSAEAEAIINALKQNYANVSATARNLNITRCTLYAKMRKYGINPRNLESTTD